MTQVTVNGNTYSDDGSTPKDMQNGGFRTHVLPMISDTMVDTAAKVAAAAAQVALANAAAASAAVSASTAVSGPGSNGTSTTSLTVGLGAQSLTIQTGKTLSPGMPCTIASTASPRNWMNGSIDSYNSGTGALQVYVTNIGLVTPGTFPTLSAWTISLSGPAAQTGVLNEQKGAPIASAATINLDTATGNSSHLTGSVGVATVILAQGAERELILDGAPPFTNSANLILPTGANIQGAAGDVITLRGEGSSVVRVTNWVRANGRALAATTPGMVLIAGPMTPAVAASLDLLSIFSSTYDDYVISGKGIVPSAYDSLMLRFANGGVLDGTSNIWQLSPNTQITSSYTPTLNYFIGSTVAASTYSNTALTFEIHLKNINSTTQDKTVFSEAIGRNNLGGYTDNTQRATYVGTSVSGLRFYWNAGSNFAAVGQICIYGLSKV